MQQLEIDLRDIDRSFVERLIERVKEIIDMRCFKNRNLKERTYEWSSYSPLQRFLLSVDEVAVYRVKGLLLAREESLLEMRTGVMTARRVQSTALLQHSAFLSI